MPKEKSSEKEKVEKGKLAESFPEKEKKNQHS